MTELMDAVNIPIGGGKIVAAVLRKNGVSSLDWFIVLHYDADHLGESIAGRESVHGQSFMFGANGVPGATGDDDSDGNEDWDDGATMDRPDPDELGQDDDIPVSHFVDWGDISPPTSRTYRKYLAMIEVMKAVLGPGNCERHPLSSLQAPISFNLDLGDGATMKCLAANGNVRRDDGGTFTVANVNTENERSLCFLIEYGGFHYLIDPQVGGVASGVRKALQSVSFGKTPEHATFLMNHQPIRILHLSDLHLCLDREWDEIFSNPVDEL